MKKLLNKIKDTLSIFSSSKGFTLLELLVVVLIIGILAGIALPQYNKAVNVAKVKAELPLIRAIFDARERCYLINNKYCFDLDEMDVDVDYTDKTCTTKKCQYTAGDYSFSMNNTNGNIYYQYKDIVNINFYGRPYDYLGFKMIASCYQYNGKNDICSALGGVAIKKHSTYGGNIYSVELQ